MIGRLSFLVFSLLSSCVFLVLDLGLFHKQAHKITTKSALYQSIFWVLISTLFGFFIYRWNGADHAVEYFSAYLTEYALIGG